MKNIYACLIGNWVCLNDDPECVIGSNRTSPNIWWEENAVIYAPIKRDPDCVDSFYGLDYVQVFYKGKDYRINPIFIQVVNE